MSVAIPPFLQTVSWASPWVHFMSMPRLYLKESLRPHSAKKIALFTEVLRPYGVCSIRYRDTFHTQTSISEEKAFVVYLVFYGVMFNVLIDAINDSLLLLVVHPLLYLLCSSLGLVREGKEGERGDGSFTRSIILVYQGGVL